MSIQFINSIASDCLSASEHFIRISDTAALIFAILGIVFILFTILFKLLTWKLTSFNTVISLTDANEDIFGRIRDLKAIAELLGIQKHFTVYVINAGAPEWFFDRLKAYYSDCPSVAAVEAEKLAELIADS